MAYSDLEKGQYEPDNFSKLFHAAMDRDNGICPFILRRDWDYVRQTNQNTGSKESTDGCRLGYRGVEILLVKGSPFGMNFAEEPSPFTTCNYHVSFRHHSGLEVRSNKYCTYY